MKNNILQNVENYNKKLDDSIEEVYNKYIGIINEYIIHHLDTLYNDNSKINPQKMHQYLITGIQCISHVFKIIILYTKNLNLTIYHSQRAFYFYVEFMEQMMEDMHTFLQLTPKDACLFVYKKTIYELNNDYRSEYNIKETKNEKTLNMIMDIYYKLTINLIENNSDHIEIIKILNNDIFKLIQNINKIQYKLNTNLFEKKLENIIDFIYDNKIENNNYKLVDKFIKKI